MIDNKLILKNKKQVKSNVSNISFIIFRTLFFIGMVYVLLFPLLIMISRSFRTVADMYNPSIIWIPQHFTLDNFKEAIDLLNFKKTALASARISLISTLLSMISCSMVGYAIGRFDFKITKVVVAITVMTIIVPIQTYLIPLFFEFRFFDYFEIGSFVNLIAGKSIVSTNLANYELPYYILAATGMGIRSGLFVLIFRQFFKTMPKELDDASRIDGCGELGTFVRVMLPNALPPYLVTFILSMVWYWNDTVYGRIILRRSPLLASKLADIKNLFLARGDAVGNSAEKTVVTFAAALLFIIPPLIMYLIAQRFFIQSVEKTGIVG